MSAWLSHWVFRAVLSAVFAALTAILAKAGSAKSISISPRSSGR